MQKAFENDIAFTNYPRIIIPLLLLSLVMVKFMSRNLYLKKKKFFYSGYEMEKIAFSKETTLIIS